MGFGDWIKGVGRKIGGAFKSAVRKVGDIAKGAWSGIKKVGSFINPVNWAYGIHNLGKKASQMEKEGKSFGEILQAGVSGLGEKLREVADIPIISATPLGLAARVTGGAIGAGDKYASGDKLGAIKQAVDIGKGAKGQALRLTA